MNDAAAEMTREASTASVVTFFAYASVVLLLAWISQRLLAKRSFLSEYFLGSRGLATLAFAMTFVATSASAGTFAGLPSLCYRYGWIVLLWIAGRMTASIVPIGLIGKRVNQLARRTGAITLPDLLSERFQNRKVGGIATALILMLLSVYLIPQFKIAALILQELLRESSFLRRGSIAVAQLAALGVLPAWADPDYLFCLLVFAGIVMIYTTFGGFRAVVWTDVMQGGVMVAGVLILFGLALSRTGGIAAATDRMSRMEPPRLATVHFIVDAPPGTPIRIPTDRWFTIVDDEETRLFRTNETATILADGTTSNAVRTVEIIGDEERSLLLQNLIAALPGSSRPVIEQESDYIRGGAGAYVRGPGPDIEKSAGFLPIGLAVSFFVYFTFAGAGQPGDLVRLMAFDSSRTLRRSIVVVSIVLALIYVPITLTFILSRTIVPGLDATPDRIMPVLVSTLCRGGMLDWIAGLLFAAPFAAAMSTVDSLMLIITSAVVRDVYQNTLNPAASERRLKLLSYASTLAIGAAVTAAAVNPPELLQILIIFAGAGLTCAIAFPLALALYWPRMTTAGALTGMIGGLLSYLALYAIGFAKTGDVVPLMPLGMEPIVWGLIASGLFCVAGTLLSPPPPRELVAKHFG